MTMWTIGVGPLDDGTFVAFGVSGPSYGPVKDSQNMPLVPASSILLSPQMGIKEDLAGRDR